MEALTVERLRALVDYDPETGILTWAARPRSDFASQSAYASFTKRFFGKEAGAKTPHGYRRVSIDYGSYYAHRIAWFHFYGEWPSLHVDHINGNGCDNRIVNLRDVSCRENHLNMRLMSNNRTGVPGVCLSRYGTWTVAISGEKGMIRLGSFQTKEEAIAVRKHAEREFGYHPNHGRAA